MMKNILFTLLASASFVMLAVGQPSPVWLPGPASKPFDCSKCDVYPTGGDFICKTKGLPGQTEGEEDGCNENCKVYRKGTTFARCIGKHLTGQTAPTK